MSRFEDYPHKCVKCGTTDEELHKFTYVRSKSKMLSGSYSSVQISFPVCFSCKQEFEKYQKIEHIFVRIKYVSLCSFIIAVVMGYTLFRGGLTVFLTAVLTGGLIVLWWPILLFLITSILTVVGIIFAMRSFGNSNKISNFIYLTKTGKVKIKDKEFANDFAEHMIAKTVEQGLRESVGIGMMTCPKCGSQQQIGTDFCNVCGKELRNL